VTRANTGKEKTQEIVSFLLNKYLVKNDYICEVNITLLAQICNLCQYKAIIKVFIFVSRIRHGLQIRASGGAPPNVLLSTEDIKTPDLPGIDTGVMPNANDATSVPTSSPLPNVSYSWEPQAFIEQGGSSSGNGGSGSLFPRGTTTALYGASAFVTYRQATQYNSYFNIWRGADGMIHHGLSGRGPNAITGSRGLAALGASKLTRLSNILTGVGMSVCEAEYRYALSQNPGPNMRRFLQDRHLRDQFFNGLGFSRFGYLGTAASFTYNLGYVIEDLTGGNIQLNPYTHDFTPIEETLRQYDESGIERYGK
jgi:hypothetical protein